MKRRWLPIALLVLTLAAAGCRYDYFFLAFALECPLGDPDCYPVNEWHEIICIRYESSPFELFAGLYDLELDLDADEVGGRYPRRLQAELMGYDMEGQRAFRYRGKRWKVNRQSGRIEERLTVNKDLIVPYGGELCINLRTKGAPLRNGWLAGILLEAVPEEIAATQSPGSAGSMTVPGGGSLSGSTAPGKTSR